MYSVVREQPVTGRLKMNVQDARELVDNLSMSLSAALNLYHETVGDIEHQAEQIASRDEDLTRGHNELAKENRELREALDRMAERYEQTKIQSDEQDNDMRQLQAECAGFRSQLEEALARNREYETKLRDNEADRIETAFKHELDVRTLRREVERLQSLENEVGTLRNRNATLLQIENATGMRGLAIALRFNRMQPVHRAIFDYYEDPDNINRTDKLLEACSNYHVAHED